MSVNDKYFFYLVVLDEYLLRYYLSAITSLKLTENSLILQHSNKNRMPDRLGTPVTRISIRATDNKLNTITFNEI